MKEKQKYSPLQIALLCVATILTAYGVYQTIRHIGADVPTSKTMFICLSYIIILYYGFYGYKTPHGNLLKYIMLFFALLIFYTSLHFQKIAAAKIIISDLIIFVKSHSFVHIAQYIENNCKNMMYDLHNF